MFDLISHGDIAHIGYFVPLTKIADFLRAGVEVTILLAGKSMLACYSSLQRTSLGNALGYAVHHLEVIQTRYFVTHICQTQMCTPFSTI